MFIVAVRPARISFHSFSYFRRLVLHVLFQKRFSLLFGFFGFRFFLFCQPFLVFCNRVLQILVLRLVHLGVSNAGERNKKQRQTNTSRDVTLPSFSSHLHKLILNRSKLR